MNIWKCLCFVSVSFHLLSVVIRRKIREIVVFPRMMMMMMLMMMTIIIMAMVMMMMVVNGAD